MDKVKVANLSDAYQRLRIMGPGAEAALFAAGFAVAPLADGAWTAVAGPENSPTVVLKQLAYAVPGFELITPAANLAAIQAQLHAAGAVTIDAAAYEARRIALGRPAPGHELTDTYNPLEAGIGWTCSDSKGCYTGQEIIARQITYDKITKSLVGLQSATLLPVGTELQAEGRTVGTVTSSALSLRGQSPLALAIVKRPHHEPGSDLRAGSEPVTVTALPFVE
jgi:folate-binding protein YgfZ